MFKKINAKIDRLRRDFQDSGIRVGGDLNKLRHKTTFTFSELIETNYGFGRNYKYTDVDTKEVIRMILDHLELDLGEIEVTKTEKKYGLKEKTKEQKKK